jgi:MoaA/NifB/PqqE/SkfB family radical SAM enzyme
MFKVIQVQTIECCNLKCSFCPNKFLSRSGSLMNLDTYKHILDDLAQLNFSGRFSPYLMNEPMMDERIAQLIALAREKIPQAYIYISTNGTLLDQEKLYQLSESGLTLLGISAYDDKIEQHLKSLDLSNLKCKVVVKRYTQAFKDIFFYNRGGLLDLGKDSVPEERCRKPFRQMYINYKGEAVLCCSDYEYKCIMGDTKQNSLHEIWENQKYQQYRFYLGQKKRSSLDLCNKCNYRGDSEDNE